ncbi:MAG: hypothetical protein ACK5FG_02730 [Chryseotalea sp.]|jgi:hypothetical protein
MIAIYTTESYLSAVKQIIAGEYRLEELVTVHAIDTSEPDASADVLLVGEQGITLAIDWLNLAPPIILQQPIAFTPENLLGLVFARLGNYERAYPLLAREHALLAQLDLHVQLAQNIIFETLPAAGTDYVSIHNAAVIAHYGELENPVGYDDIRLLYRQALAAAPNDELRAFTAKHYATLLADTGDIKNAERLLLDAIPYALSDAAKISLKTLLSSIWLAKLVVPYDKLLMEQLKELLWECLQYYEKKKLSIQAAFVLLDASAVANYDASFSESLGYICKAIDLLRREEQPELLAQAHMRKGNLLFTWAQNGNTQFYKGAMEALQEAAKVFTREHAPQQFADIQHVLGIIFSEIPDEAKKKSVWAAVSSSSFKEALQYYTKEEFPYEYATICNHYANAYIKYPASRNSDNVAKALDLFNEALAIRRADTYPVERALTLLNYIEASWYADNSAEPMQMQQNRLKDMHEKLQEIRLLSQDETILAEVKAHEQKLQELTLLLESNTG